MADQGSEPFRRLTGFVDVVNAIKAVALRREQYHASIAERHGLSMSKIDCLYYVVIGGPQPMSVLGERIGLTASAMTAAIDQLEDRGLVTRVRSRQDRRVTLIAATEAGERIIVESMNNLSVGFAGSDLDLTGMTAQLQRAAAIYQERRWHGSAVDTAV